MKLFETINPEKFDAVLFDLDGVLTPTAKIHAECWKRLFDEFCQFWSKRHNVRVASFDIKSDYLNHVDGRPRYDGVRSFLQSRGIVLPEGDPTSPPGFDTVCALGNRKDGLFNEILATEGIEPFPGSLSVLRELRQAGLRTAVVSSSKNCQAVLQAAKIETLFDVRVDGRTAEQLGLAGKPAPDTFLEAARKLGVRAARAVVVEDAIVGVEAGRAGNFGLVIGIARHGDAGDLKAHGADLVVSDLAEVL
jgi:beta-phosphoglucomutase family hydrolase